MNGQEYLHAASRLGTDEGLDPWTALMRVLVLQLQSMEFPAALQPVRSHAVGHWAGRPAALPELKAEVWRYLQALGPAGADLSTAAGRSARALLCVLEEAGDAEALSMTADWFAAMTSDE